MHGDQARNAAAFGEDFAHAMAGRLGRSHADVDACRRHDGLEVDVESMGKQEQLAGGEIRRDLFGIQLGRGLIGNQHHHHVGPLGGFSNRADFKPGLLCLGDRFGSGGQAHLDLDARSLRLRAWACPWEP